MANQKIIRGIEGLVPVLKGAKRILLCTGKKSYQNSSYRRRLEELLSDFEVSHFCDIFPNPKGEELEVGISFADKVDYDMVLAVGGGSVIDSAKIINFFCAQKISIYDYFNGVKRQVVEPKPIIAIPTTSGTGSESTQFATLYIEKIKKSLDHPFNLPTAVVLDGIFSLDLPPYVTAYTGVDALSQAIESYWNINSNEYSKRLAKEAMVTIVDNLPRVIKSAGDNDARLQMAIGANLAGQAIQITKTTAPHAISYPMTSFFNIPHGEAVGMSLPHVLEFNANVSPNDLNDSRGVDYVIQTIDEIASLLGVSTAVQAKEKLISLFNEVGLKTKLSLYGLSESDLQVIVSNGFNPDRVKNNPRLLTKEKLMKLLHQMF